MANLTSTRKRFQSVATVLAAIAAIAALLVFLPLRPSAEQKEFELNDAKLQAKRLEAEVAPLRGLPNKLVQARTDIATFYQERFADRFSAMPETLGDLSSKHGVRLSDVKYETAETNFAGIQEVSMEANLSGEYAKVVGFINALERSQVFLLIDKITLAEEGATGGGEVRLQIRILTVLRSSPASTVTSKKTGGRTS